MTLLGVYDVAETLFINNLECKKLMHIHLDVTEHILINYNEIKQQSIVNTLLIHYKTIFFINDLS